MCDGQEPDAGVPPQSTRQEVIASDLRYETPNARRMTDRIAIVSVAGRFPGSGADLNHFWANIAAAADCSREVPPGRWILPPESCADPRIGPPG